MEMEKVVLVPQKKVTVFSTLGKNAQEFQTSATTWGELQKNLKEMSISFSGMKAVIGENKHTLESENALLPFNELEDKTKVYTDFTLYLMPVKTKSGYDRKEMFSLIKEFVGKDAAKKALFTVNGKNMTQLSTPVLEQLVTKHIGNGKTPASVAGVTATAKIEAPVTKETYAASGKTPVVKTEGKINESPTVDKLVATIENALSSSKHKDTVMTAVAQLVAILGGDLSVAVGNTTAAPVAKEEAKESDADRMAREEKQRKKELNDRLANEANDMMREFSDVRR